MSIDITGLDSTVILYFVNDFCAVSSCGVRFADGFRLHQHAIMEKT